MSDERWQRLEGLVDRDVLREARVAVVGVGSGGSTVALELAKAGVGRFTLIDPDLLEEANLIRHECDDRYLGQNKAVAVADLIAHRSPEAEIEALCEDVFEMEGRLESIVAASDITAVCVDSEPAKHFLNQLCTIARAPAVYAGVYSRAAGGEIIRCSGDLEDPCYACAMSVLKESAPTPVEAEELDYGAIAEDGTVHGAPGLGIDVRFVALIQAKVCLGMLLERRATSVSGTSGIASPPADVVLFGNEPMEGLFPRAYASAFVRVARQEECLVCGPVRVDELV